VARQERLDGEPTSHESAQHDEGVGGSWVHADLHRKEGNPDNAAYWYGRVRKPVCTEPLDAEWLSIVRDFAGVRGPCSLYSELSLRITPEAMGE
jgi:hypothetical protein